MQAALKHIGLTAVATREFTAWINFVHIPWERLIKQ